eukprot:tig00021441_g21545.t1
MMTASQVFALLSRTRRELTRASAAAVDLRMLCAGPGATCRSARFRARRPAGCLSFVDSRLCAVPGHLSLRRLPRRLPQLRRLQAMRRARRHLPLRPLPRPPPCRLPQRRRLQAMRRARRNLSVLPLPHPPPCRLPQRRRLQAMRRARRHLSVLPLPRPPPPSPARQPGAAARLATPSARLATPTVRLATPPGRLATPAASPGRPPCL